MLRFAMLSLTCALTAGVFSAGEVAPVAWQWGQNLFFIFLGVSVVFFVGGTLGRPSVAPDEVESEPRRSRWRDRRFDHRLPELRPTRGLSDVCFPEEVQSQAAAHEARHVFEKPVERMNNRFDRSDGMECNQVKSNDE